MSKMRRLLFVVFAFALCACTPDVDNLDEIQRTSMKLCGNYELGEIEWFQDIDINDVGFKSKDLKSRIEEYPGYTSQLIRANVKHFEYGDNLSFEACLPVILTKEDKDGLLCSWVSFYEIKCKVRPNKTSSGKVWYTTIESFEPYVPKGVKGIEFASITDIDYDECTFKVRCESSLFDYSTKEWVIGGLTYQFSKIL